jgi:putative flippase GtrA
MDLRESRKRLLAQMVRYSLVGGATVLLDYAILVFLTEFVHVYYLLSSVCAFIAALIFNYLLSLHWVFNESALSGRVSVFLSYSLIGVIGLVVNACLMWLLTEAGGLHYLVSKGLSSLVVFVWNFIARRQLLRVAKART